MTNIATALSSGTAPAAPAAPNANASSSTLAAPTDFLQLFAKISGDPAQQAITPFGAAAMLGTAEDASEEDAVDADSLLIAGLPIAFPMVQPETKLQAGMSAGAQVNALTSGKSLPGNLGELQMVTDMIEGELALARDAQATLESFQLPVSQVEQAAPKHTLMLDTQRAVHSPVGSSQWADELGSRLTLMTEQGKQAASLRLSPEHLGPLEIRIAVTEDRASVWFGAAHADTRAAIEHALPRLREMFEAQGMSLADAGVYEQAPREQPELTRQSNLGAGETQEADAALTQVRVNLGLVDAYA
jgi:flagellar hook-length control protein FliK